MNFPLEHKVFKNLIPTNINDSVLLEEHKSFPRPSKPPMKTEKHPEPNLLDYLDPLKPFERNFHLEYPPETFLPPKGEIAREEMHVLFSISEID